MIATDRLVLREMNEDDFDALGKVLMDRDIMQHYPYAFDEEKVRAWIRRNIERYRIFGGAIKPEIGYHIRADHQRKGYASEAACAVRDWAFENTPFRVIYSYMKYTNIPSANTAQAYGCKQVDEFEDEVNEITKVFAITREEWQSLKK